MAQDYIEDLESDKEEGGEEITIHKHVEKEAPEVAPPPRSIRNIAPSNRSRVSRFGAPQGSPSDRMRPRTHQDTEGSGEGNRAPKRTILVWALVLLVLMAFGFAVSSIFRKTTVDIMPRTHTTVFDEQTVYTAYPAGSTSAPQNSLRYETQTGSVEASMPVTASGTEEVSEASSGTITVYNGYSESSVRLIKNTRFEAPGGRIFRVRDSIMVPGKSASAPGTLVATVYADEPGADYNIGPVERFSVPGLKDTPEMFSTIYARSEQAMSGGFIGTRPSITESAKEAADAQLTAQLEAKISEEARALADHYALISYADIAYAPLSLAPQADGSLLAKKTATIVMPVIAHTVLDPFLAAQTNAASDRAESIRIDDHATLSLRATNTASVPTLGSDMLDFSITGNATFVWAVDTEQLAADLAGKNKAAFEAIVSGYPAIDSATAKVYPLWSQQFPKEPSSIRTVVKSADSSR